MSLSTANRVVGRDGSPIDGIQIARDRNYKVYYYEDKIDVFEDKDPEELDVDISKKIDKIVRELGLVTLSVKNRLDIESDILAGEVPRSKEGKRIHAKLRDYITAVEHKGMMTGGIFVAIPNKIRNQNNRIYIFGTSGSGKSTWASNFAKEYIRENPGNRVFLFSRKDYDPVFDDEIPDIIRTKLDLNFVKNYRASMAEEDPILKYADSLVIFDDFMRIDEPTIRSTALQLKNSIFELSRQYGTDCISIMHKGMGGHSTMVELTESTMIVCFPRRNLGESMKVLRTYCCFDREQMNQIFNKEGKNEQWMCVRRPDVIITKNYIKVID